ncbi:class I SAM-dependent methyltransferase [soil metagenome]
MERHEFLQRLHTAGRPRNYLEIGVSDGSSLALSRVPSIAVDPEYRITAPLHCDVQMVRKTSDEFFRRRDPIVHLRSGRNPIRNMRRGRPLLARFLGGTTVDLAFIDGMHLFEYVLRDFMNVERFSGPASIIALDDMLPRNVDEAARRRHTSDWTGDVFKLMTVLREHRPDLVLLPIDTEPTGILVVLGADPTSVVLRDRYDQLLSEWITPDPQSVPPEIINRRNAIDPLRFLSSPILESLIRGRGARGKAERVRESLREQADALRL